MGGFNGSAVSANGPSVPSLLTYAARANWDAAHRRILFAGTSHTGGQVISGAGGLITWDDATNQVTRESYSWSSENPGHSYYHTALNPNNGNMYFRSYNSASIYRRVFGQTGQGSWSTSGVANHPNPANQVAGGLEWFSEANGGSGGLVFVDAAGACLSNANVSSWSRVSAGSGNYHNWAVRAGGSVYFGGGNGSSAMWRLNPSGSASSQPSTPLQAGVSAQAIVLPHPNGNGLLLFESNTGSGAIYYFNGSSWSSVSGRHQINAANYWAGCAIPEYGVIVFLVHPDGTGTPYTRVYKP
jgi:hypothetical protein